MKIYISKRSAATSSNESLSLLLRKQKTRQRAFGIFLLLGLIICFVWNLCSTTSSSYLAGDEPDWLENTISTTANISNVEAGPCYWSNDEHYLAYDIRFYNAITNQQITDYKILEELLNMFQYTNEPFVYDRSRSFDGNCFLYYNGIVPAKYGPALFSGFKGKENFPECSSEKIDSIYIVIYCTYSSEVRYKHDIQRQLDEMQKSKILTPY